MGSRSDSPPATTGHPAFLGGLSCQAFLDRHWQKSPLFIGNAFPQWTDCITPDELAGFALEEAVESRILIEHDQQQWQLLHGPFTEASFSSLPPDRWTLLVQALDHYVPAFATLLDDFNFLPQWRIDDLMMSYATAGGSVGPHYDYYDVFLIQISGRRRWQIGQHCNDQTPLVPGLPVRILRDFQCSDSWEVGPGDMLYLPPGIAHHGVALDDDCMTLSVGFRAPSYADIISEFSHHVAGSLSGGARYEDRALSARTGETAHSGLLADEDVDRVASTLTSLLGNRTELINWMASYLSLPKYEHLPPQPCHLSEPEVAQQLARGELVQRDENSRFIWAPQAESPLYINGEPVRFPETARSLAEYLTTQRRFETVSLLARARGEPARLWLTQLIQKGLLYFYEP